MALQLGLDASTVTPPKKKTSGSGSGNSLAQAITGTPAVAPSLGGGAIGTGATPQTTTTTVTPLQVYQDQILSDPGSTAAEGSFNANVSNLASARQDAIQRAIINAGWNPGQLSGGLASYAGDVTPTTLAAAAANPLSQAAQLNQQLQEGNANLPYDLAASGLNRSGAAAIGAGQLQQQYQTASYQGLQDLLSSISGAANTYASGYNSAQSQLEAAREAVAARLAQNAGYTSTTTTSGGDSYDDGSSAATTAAPPVTQSSYQPATPTSQAVTRVISQLKTTPKQKQAALKADPRVFQDLRNIKAG